MSKLRDYLQLIRFSHTVFALPFALLAAAMVWLGPKPIATFHWKNLLGIVLCMATARAAAMAFNRLVDRRYDALNPRTAERHLPAGRMRLGQVVGLTVIASVGFIASTLLFLPETYVPIAASIPVLLFLLSYSYSKRFTSLSHYWLGAALMLAPPAAWIAAGGPMFHFAPWTLALAVFFWVGGFDIIYACQDASFDRNAGLRSLPARLGIGRALRVAAASHVMMILTLLSIPWFFPAFGTIYYVGIALIGLLLIYEHAIVRPNDLRAVNRAFLHVNSIISLGLFTIGLVDLLW